MTTELTLDGYLDFDEFTITKNPDGVQVDFLMEGKVLYTQTVQMSHGETFSVQGIIGYLKYHLSGV